MFKNKGYLRIKEIILVLFMALTIFCTATHQKENGLIYVLQWTNRQTEPFTWWAEGSESLVSMNCAFKNCFLTADHSYLPLTDFDVILFNAPDIHDMTLPAKRAGQQIYIFVSTESEANYEISKKFDLFFNYTWTYKLNSDIIYPYFVVRNKSSGAVVAPKNVVHWMTHNEMEPTLEYVINQLQNKSIAAAWFVSNCYAINDRIIYIRNLRSELIKLGHDIDIYGNCDANKECPRFSFNCFELVKANYFFYLSFENSFSDDYVTEKILTAVENYAVPVVFGGANYSRYANIF